MTVEYRNAILNQAIVTYGVEMQQDMCIEEMSELTKAILKWRRFPVDGNEKEREGLVDNIIEEMADVQIMLDQLRAMFGDTTDQENYKLNRLLARMEAQA